MKKLFAGNWKMYKTHNEAVETVKKLITLTSPLPKDREVLIIPPYPYLKTIGDLISKHNGYILGAQNFYPEDEGAYTGEVSPKMLLDVGCSYSIVGHSERRKYFNENDEFINRKVRFGLQKGLKIILCIGEDLTQRKKGEVFKVLERQILKDLDGIRDDKIEEKLCVAYEPVWAIGTGEVATPIQIEEAHKIIRELLANLFGEKGGKIRILYGGSVNPENIKDILPVPNVNGVLVGGASLKAESFSKIVLT